MARRLLVESLEPRTLLAADVGWAATLSMEDLTKMSASEKADVVPTHYYKADGVDRGMVIVSDRVAISRGSQPSRQSSNVAGPQPDFVASFGLTELLSLDDSFRIYSTQQPVTGSLMESLKDSGFADAVVPVFGMLESQSEAVLLNEVIVALPEGVRATEYFSDAKFTSYRSLDGTQDQFVATLSAGYGEKALQAIQELEGDSRVEWVSPNFYQNWQKFAFTPNDPRFTNQWHLHNTGQGGGQVDADPNLPEAWEYFQPGGPPTSITIGMVDDGMVTDHPDLNAWINTGEIPGNGIDDDGNGWIDDIRGWNFVNNNNISTPDTSLDNHGTAVSGVAAARGNNGIGVTGASYNSSVISARMFRGSSVATDANIAAAIYYTSGRTRDGSGTWPAASIVNHSWGGGAVSTAINNSLTWATTHGRGGLGVIHVFASGNEYDSSVSYPSSLSATNPGVISIGALNNFGERSNYSNYGSALDVVTPSDDTRSGYLSIDTTDRLGSPGYASGDYTGTGSTGFGGTSSATPLAVGIGALALARAEQLDVDLTAADLKQLFRVNTKLAGSAAYDLNTGRTAQLGYGLLNAESLVKGIGRAQVSVTTERVVLDNGGEVHLGEAIVGGIAEATFRVRNQGTETLSLVDLSISSTDFVIGTNFGDTELAIGESTTFTLRFAPQSAGLKTGTVSIASNDDQRPSLEFDVLGLAKALTISGYFFEDRNGNGVRDVGEATVQGQSIFIDENGNGVFDAILNSHTFTNTTLAPINDNSTTTSLINISGVGASVSGLNVTINLNHTYIGDLDITLVSPEGTRVLLINRRGSGGDNMVNTVFDDQAAQAITASSPPYTGSFRPEQPLANLNGSAIDGTWKLEVRDNAGGDQGTLLNWTLAITGSERIATTDASGFYYFLDIGNGSYSAIGSAIPGWTATSAVQYPFTVTDPNDSFTHDIGVGKNNRFYAHVYNDLNGNGFVNSGEAGLPGRTLFLDANSNGIFDPPVQVNITNSTATPINDSSTINLPIVVSGVGEIADVDVTVNLTHTWVGDLELSLISPMGTQIMLSNRRGSSGDNYTNTRFDQEATTSITAASPPFTGTFRPEGDLSQLYGLSGNGTWNLRIRDLAGGDQGTFLNWTLHLTTPSDVELLTDSYGWTYADLPEGTSTITLLPEAGWEYTAPASGSRQATDSGVPYYNQLFGTRVPVEGIASTFVYHAGWTGVGSSIDSVKSLAKEGTEPQTLNFDNLINTSHGINGIGFENENIPGTLTASDFVFQVSPTGTFDEGTTPPSSWDLAPAPSSINVVPGATDQVWIEWADNAIANRWLRVTVKANANTGLSAPEVYYLGHLLGEATGPDGGYYTVNFLDIGEIRTASGDAVDAGSIHDINKSGLVSFVDVGGARTGVGEQLTNITVGGSGSELLGTVPEDSFGSLVDNALTNHVTTNVLSAIVPSIFNNLVGNLFNVDTSAGRDGVSALDFRLPGSANLEISVQRQERIVAVLATDLGRATLSVRSTDLDAVDKFFAELSLESELAETVRK